MANIDDFKAWLDTVLSNSPATKLRGDVFNAGLDTNLADKMVWLDQGLVSSGSTLLFDNPLGRVYPDWNASGITGNITLSSTNAVVGGVAYLKHTDSTAFSDPAEVINPTHIYYVDQTDNYFEFVCVSVSPFKVFVRTLAPPGVTTLDGLSDVSASAPTTGSMILWDGANWSKDLRVQGAIMTGQNLAFDSIAGRLYPSFADTGKTGVVTFFSTGATIGGKAYLKHNDSSEPAWPASLANPGDVAYEISTDNYLEFVCIAVSPFSVWVNRLAAPGGGTTGSVVDGGALPALMTSAYGRYYGSWGSPITADTISLNIAGAVNLGWALIYVQHTDPNGPVFILPNGGEIVKEGYAFVADQVNRVFVQFHTGGKITVQTGGAVQTIDTTAPAFVSAAVEDATPTFIDAIFDERVYGTSLSNWDVVVDGGGAVNPIAISNSPPSSTPSFQLAAAITGGQTVTIEHTASGSDFQDSVGNALENVAATAVTNNVAGGGGWTPASLPGQVLWLDPDDDTTVTTVDDAGETVFTNINDKFQAIAIPSWPGFDAARPVRATLGGGERVFQSRSGASHFMYMRLAHAAANAIAAGSGLTVAFSCYSNATATAGIISKGNSGADSQLVFFENWDGKLATEIQETVGAGGNRMDSANASDFFDAAAVSAGLKKVVVFTMTAAGAKILRIDGVQVASETGAAIVANTGDWYFFTDIGSSYWDGYVGNIVILNTDISGTDLTNLETYLS